MTMGAPDGPVSTVNARVARYAPGDWYAVVAPDGAAVLDAGLAPELVDDVWQVLRAGGGLGDVLQVLTGAFGTSLTAIPPFAVAVQGADGLHVAVRGALVARVGAAGGDVEVSGAGVTTWSERLVPGARGVTLVPGGLDGNLSRGLPLESGIVRASAVSLPLGAGASAAVRAVPPEPLGQPDVAPLPLPPPPPVPVAAPAPAPVEHADHEEDSFVDQTRTEVPDDGYDHLWGSTMIRSVEDAAVREDPDADAEADDAPAPPAPSAPPVVELPVEPPPSAPAWQPPRLIGEVEAPDGVGVVPAEHADPRPAHASEAAPVPADLGDHDGETVMGFSRASLPDGPEPAAEQVVDVAPPRDARRSRGRVLLSTGGEVDLDRPLVVGRKPRASRVGPGELPRLVTVPSPDHDISRSHVEVRLEDLHVLVVDLGATNGTTLLRPGQAPVRLHPHEAVLVVSGDVLDLGSSVQLTFEVTA